jgi:hypothetical protein
MIFKQFTPVVSQISMYHLNYRQLKVTNSMEQSPSWEAKKSSATQEIPRIL